MTSSFADSFGGDSLTDNSNGYLAGYTDSPIVSDAPSPQPFYAAGGEFRPELDGDTFVDGDVALSGKNEGDALRDWSRENAIRLEEKEKREKELLSHILAEAEDYKVDYLSRRKVNCETNKVTNRETEKVLVATLEKVHAEADKNYWKTIAELIPKEVTAIEMKREKRRGEEKKPSIVVVKGPKPGKPTELSRMRHLLLKLKYETPSHLQLSAAPTKDTETVGVVNVAMV